MLDIHKKKNIYKKIFLQFFVSYRRKNTQATLQSRGHKEQYEQMFNGEHTNVCSEKHMFGEGGGFCGIWTQKLGKGVCVLS